MQGDQATPFDGIMNGCGQDDQLTTLFYEILNEPSQGDHPRRPQERKS